MKRCISGTFAAFVGAGMLLTTPYVAHGEIGVFAAANRDLTGERPSEAARPIFLQDKVVANERISSSAEGGGQILFLDQSSLTISPNSDIVLDQYIYDPDADSGEIGLTVLKGAMRLVGGRITKKNAALIRTPTATIGIRGGMGSASVDDDGTTRYMHIAGISSNIKTDSGELTITREGGYAEISPGGEIDYLGSAPEGFVKTAYSNRSAGNGNGGGEAENDDTAGGVDGVEEVVSGDEEATEQPPISTSGEQQDGADDEAAFETTENEADEESSETLLDDIGTEFNQEIDSLLVNGTFAATIIADFDGNGSPGVSTSTEKFVFAYSISSDQGVVVFGLPDTGDDLAVDAQTLSDIQAVGLDKVLARAGALGILNEPGVDGFLVSGFPLGGGSPGGGTEGGGFEIPGPGPGEPNSDPGNTNVSAEFDPGTGPGPGDIVSPILVDRDNVAGRAANESFAGGGISNIALDIDETRQLRGNFEIIYDGNPEFTSLDQVNGAVDLTLSEQGGGASEIENSVADLRVLVENDGIGNAPGPGAPPE